jgi:hypothetical protein
MNFSELFKQSGQLCRFSPDGKYLVTPKIVLILLSVNRLTCPASCMHFITTGLLIHLSDPPGRARNFFGKGLGGYLGLHGFRITKSTPQ